MERLEPLTMTERLEILRNGKTGATDMTQRMEILRNGKTGSTDMTGRRVKHVKSNKRQESQTKWHNNWRGVRVDK